MKRAHDILSAGWEEHLLTGRTDWARMARERHERSQRRRPSKIGARIATWQPLHIIACFMTAWLVLAVVLLIVLAA